MDPDIDNLVRQLEVDPHNWAVRARLAEFYEGRGDIRQAAQVLIGALELPEERAHLALGTRVLANVNPELALQYIRRLSVSPAGSSAESAKAVATFPESEESEAGLTVGGFASLPPPRRRHGFGVLTTSILLHAALLIVAAFWVVYTIFPERKEKLDFTSERPSDSANHKAAEHEVKMAKKKNMGAAPNARRIATTASASISIPAVPDSSISDFNPGMMGGAGLGLGGFGGGVGGGGGMGRGGGGGRIKFFGFEGDSSNIVLAIDTSGSMLPSCGGEAGIAKLREEINRTINSLSPFAIFNIICFGRQADACFAANARATPENKARAIAFMEGYYGAGGFGATRTEKLIADNAPAEVDFAEIEGVKFTPLTVNKVKGLEDTSGGSRMDLAVIAAMERRAETIFLLSDGKPGTARDGKPLEQDDLIKFIRSHYERLYKTKPLTIHTIYTNTDKSEEDFMKKISRRFNGKHKDVKLG
ncbi:MAG: hypothetical protein ACR2OZ_05120 [Verrucomicrobiales bacterium]